MCWNVSVCRTDLGRYTTTQRFPRRLLIADRRVPFPRPPLFLGSTPPPSSLLPGHLGCRQTFDHFGAETAGERTVCSCF